MIGSDSGHSSNVPRCHVSGSIQLASSHTGTGIQDNGGAALPVGSYITEAFRVPAC